MELTEVSPGLRPADRLLGARRWDRGGRGLGGGGGCLGGGRGGGGGRGRRGGRGPGRGGPGGGGGRGPRRGGGRRRRGRRTRGGGRGGRHRRRRWRRRAGRRRRGRGRQRGTGTRDAGDHTGGADVALPPDRGHHHHRAGVGGMDHQAVADVQADVVDGGRVAGVVGVEEQVAGEQVRHVDVGTGVPLGARHPRDRRPRGAVGRAGQH